MDGQPKWQTSQWARVYDWDWMKTPFPNMDANSLAVRQRQELPNGFYHVLQATHVLEIDRVNSDSSDLEKLTIYDTVAYALLEHFREPAPLASALSGAWIKKYGRDSVINSLKHLRDLRLLNPEGTDEPVDTGAVAGAAAILYGAIQLQNEFAGALTAVHEILPKTALEIGTAYGGSLFGWAQVAHPEALLVSVDMPLGAGGGGYFREHVAFFRQFCQPRQRLQCIRADSTAPSTINQVRRQFDSQPVDFLFIDGDHSYEGVRTDFENYGPMVRKGGIVAFHDIQPLSHATNQVIEVSRFWNDIKDDYPHDEFINDPDQSGAGIGILHV